MQTYLNDYGESHQTGGKKFINIKRFKLVYDSIECARREHYLETNGIERKGRRTGYIRGAKVIYINVDPTSQEARAVQKLRANKKWFYQTTTYREGVQHNKKKESKQTSALCNKANKLGKCVS